MNKTKSNAKWNQLTTDQQATLEDWLFEDDLSYDDALARAHQELGFTGSRASLCRFYKHKQEERRMQGFVDAAAKAQAVEGADVSVETLRGAGIKVAAQVFFDRVLHAPDDTDRWLPLAKMLTQEKKNEAWERCKEREHELRLDTLAFAREKFEYNLVERALRSLPELQELAQARKDPQTRKFEENKRINNLRKRMFGNDIPELLPESESEETIPSGEPPAPRGFSNARAEAPPRPPVGRHVPPNAASSNAPSSGATPGPVKRGLLSRLFSSRDTTPSPATDSPVAPVAPSVPTRPSQPAEPTVPGPTGRFPELMKLLPHLRRRMFEQNKKINDLRKALSGPHAEIMGLWPENDAELADPNFSGLRIRHKGMGFAEREALKGEVPIFTDMPPSPPSASRAIA